jgi:NTE family protein
VPGINPPVAVAGRLYVDGGLGSATNLDVLAEPAAGAPLDRVLVSAPLSCAAGYAPRSWLRPARRLFRRQLAAEARRLRRRGAAVHLLQPSGAVLAAMGINPFAVQRMDRVARAAYRATRAALHRAERRGGPLAALAAALRAAAG